MKTKKTKIVNSLKLGIFLFGVSLLLLNCEKEQFKQNSMENSIISIQQIKKKFKNQFEIKYFPYLKKEPLWDKLQTSIYQGIVYYEIPFYDLQDINRKKSTSLSADKLVAFKNEKNEIELNILHFYIPKANQYTSNFISLENTENIDGFLSFYDLKNRNIKTKRFINGKESFRKYIVKDIKENGNQLYPNMPMDNENCETHTEQRVIETCWFWIYDDGHVEIINCNYEYYTKEYTSCEGAGGGGGNGTTYIKEDIVVQVIDSLTGKTKCIYEKLKNTSTGFKNAIQKFDGEFPVSHLKLTINNNLSSTTYGETQPPVNFITEIQFNENKFSDLSDLGKATVFAHEIIHAEIFRKMLSAAQRGDLNTNTMTAQEAENYVNSLKNNFPGLYDYYAVRYHPTWNHNMMASHYRNTIADMIQEFDNYRLTRSTYEAVSWAGLGKLENNQNTIAWDSLVNKSAIDSLINLNIFNGPSNCN